MSRASVLALGLMLSTVGCEALGGAGQRPEGTRQITLRLPEALTRDLGSHVTGLQLAAVVVPTELFSFHTSAVVDPAAQGTLVAYLPVAESPVLVLQTPGQGSSPGQLIARLMFADGQGGQRSRLPASIADLDLQTPDYQAATPVAALQLDETANPLAQHDRDGDGQSDLIDADDDDDGTPDSSDPDADGDEIEDARQGFDALEDADQNGIPDLFE